MKADAKPTFDDVAKLIANPPPDWLSPALGVFKNIIKVGITSDEHKEYAAEIDRAHNAVKTLRRLLPMFLSLPIGETPELNRGPVDVLVVLDALPRIERMLARANFRRSKRTPVFYPQCCAAVIIEASRIVLGKAQPRSEVFTYSICDAYYQACGNQSLGDIENWRRPVKRGMTEDNVWIKDIFQRCQVLQIDP